MRVTAGRRPEPVFDNPGKVGQTIFSDPGSFVGARIPAIRLDGSGVWTLAANQPFLNFIGAQVGTYDDIISGLSGSETNLITGMPDGELQRDANFTYNFRYDNVGGVM